jgi:hypothetical protein
MKRKTVLTAVVLLGLFCAAVAQGSIAISTAYGSGADTWVSNGSSEKSTVTHGSATSLYARYIGGGSRCSMTYLRFDISQEAGSFTGTTLSLNEVWAKGAAKTLQVYGLVDETLDSWVESTTCYANAPGMLTPSQGNDLGYYAIDSTKLTLLGTITVPVAPAGTSSSGGTVNVVFTSDPTLLDLGSFLNQDTNNLVTLVIINASGTSGSNSEDRFASKENTTAGILFPTLTTPEPATMLLLGLGGLLLRKRS